MFALGLNRLEVPIRTASAHGVTRCGLHEVSVYFVDSFYITYCIARLARNCSAEPRRQVSPRIDLYQFGNSLGLIVILKRR